MGPPEALPFSSIIRYLTASTPSAYLVAIPKKAASHIQKSAPGPPAFTAVATPTILPVPTVAARAVHKAWKLLMSPLPVFLAAKMSFSAMGSLNTCNKFKRMVRRIPVPIKRIIKGGPHTKPFTVVKNSNITTPHIIFRKQNMFSILTDNRIAYNIKFNCIHVYLISQTVSIKNKAYFQEMNKTKGLPITRKSVL